MATTLADIAEALSVSKMTVSRAINNDPAVHPETRARVLELARRMNYRPNHHARALATRRSHLLGLVVPDLMHSYFAEIAKAIEVEARAAHYEVVICNTDESGEAELREVEALRHRTDGLIIASAVAPEQVVAYRKMLREGAHIALVDRRLEGLRCPVVTTDNVRVGRMATEHLIGLGHRRIGHLRGADVLVARDRLKGYQEAMASHGLRQEAGLIRDCGFLENSGYEAMRDWIRRGKLPSAIFAGNDPAAIGAIRALMESGLHVPQDVAIVGAGNIHYGDLLGVPLTTVTWNKTEMGQFSARCLLSELSRGSSRTRRAAGVEVVLEPELVIRKSCGAKK
jgi:LacI family transcriptional regulator